MPQLFVNTISEPKLSKIKQLKNKIQIKSWWRQLKISTISNKSTSSAASSHTTLDWRSLSPDRPPLPFFLPDNSPTSSTASIHNTNDTSTSNSSLNNSNNSPTKNPPNNNIDNLDNNKVFTCFFFSKTFSLYYLVLHNVCMCATFWFYAHYMQGGTYNKTACCLPIYNIKKE